MVTLCTCRCHNCCIGNRWAVVAANRTCKAGRHTDNKKLWACREYCRNNRNKYSKCSPRRSGCKSENASDKEYIGSLFKKLFSVWTSKGEGYYFESLSLVYKILANLQKTNYLPIDQYSLIEPAINEIEKNFLYKNLTSEYLASVCGISETRLARIFKKKFGLPIKKYIIQKKMNYACELLRLNIYSVAQIADMCNFSDVYFFSKQFKVHTGTTPTEYIKNAQF